ncbi:UTP--glucose-1-phosphate uridylyltransferase GalU [Accumulibacter sp.]|jgi:UTP--glucose-1-phosphate uridylyltransferase|uniref:UTP--glucose-1-phosphate uridylyltransferase GalU n=1 Tax=Accumulibacter sp. TaxID=2053492 RepID=UPI001AD5EA5B|nr:UTP--glucose-1-phosphate uridylyltransferase GalU [Accumulibacter sp.]MBN8453895.1 UTP--glucose-1-phosphate uridylyltransferase GalU [Accumulibacter sp.]MBO3708644.1 UTP--glucose-1-phosphate uridylyltransferase GalU [Candidatus Accumulibacter conexus]
MKVQTKVQKAVFPVAGLGTRFLPATKASPKEMLAVVDKPLIQYAVEEAYAAGIREMIFVTGRNKRAIEDHFDTAYELEAELASSGKDDLMALVHSIKPDDMDCVYVRQPRALGLGHAVLCAERLVRGEPFAVLLADDLMIGEPPIMRQMTELFARRQCSILAVQEVPKSQTNRYGIVKGLPVAADLVNVEGLIEKPHPSVAPSNLAVAGRYVLTPAVFEHIRGQPRGAGGEIQLTDGIAALLASERVLAYRYHGRRYDCGSKLGLMQASVVLGETHPELGREFSAWLKDRQKLAQTLAG